MEFLYVPIPKYNFYSTDIDGFHNEWCCLLKSKYYLSQAKLVVDLVISFRKGRYNHYSPCLYLKFYTDIHSHPSSSCW